MAITVTRSNAHPGFEHCRFKARNGYLQGFGKTEQAAIDALNERIGRLGWKGDHDFTVKPD
ncbi:hypothetical protein [Halomonas sp. Cn5-12]|uniref:hypothetical protein n=1 Tax=Halomonas sp. Cn5-12 TaxID=2908885 RepID=UPI001F40B0E4|nr:hypothetical protein [Halomonas sp. Cn5-12]MCF2911885.1 hypothetical protein [Halomonas sp. Cn5-12]